MSVQFAPSGSGPAGLDLSAFANRAKEIEVGGDDIVELGDDFGASLLSNPSKAPASPKPGGGGGSIQLNLGGGGGGGNSHDDDESILTLSLPLYEQTCSQDDGVPPMKPTQVSVLHMIPNTPSNVAV